MPQVASEDIIDIGNGRYAHFRRDRRFAQVQVMFTAPEGVDPNPGRELTDQFKELGWTWRPNEPGKPWIYQLDKSSEHDPTARGDSRDALHEQFLIIIQEYREKHGMPPTIGWQSLAESDTKAPNADRRRLSSSSVADQAASISEKQMPPSAEKETRAGGRPAAGDARRLRQRGSGAVRPHLDRRRRRQGRLPRQPPLEQLRAAMPAILQEAAERQHNVIVRPRSSGATLIQLDDLGEDAAERLRPASFLVLRTSPGNYQAWVAVADADADFARRLRKGAGADLTASGATRVSGSLNFKEKYAPDFPRVETVHASPGKVVTRAELEALGVVAPEEKATPADDPLRHRTGAQRLAELPALRGEAPRRREGGRPDSSRADFTFCLLAIDWGWGVEETAARLMQESGKAQENGEAYALRTARKAAEASGAARGAAAVSTTPPEQSGPGRLRQWWLHKGQAHPAPRRAVSHCHKTVTVANLRQWL